MPLSKRRDRERKRLARAEAQSALPCQGPQVLLDAMLLVLVQSGATPGPALASDADQAQFRAWAAEERALPQAQHEVEYEAKEATNA